MSQSDNTLDIRGSEVAAAPRYDSTDSSLAEKHYAKEGFSDERFTAQDGAGAVPGDSLAEKLTFKHDLHRGLKSRQIAMVLLLPCTTKLDCDWRCYWNRSHHRHGGYT